MVKQVNQIWFNFLTTLHDVMTRYQNDGSFQLEDAASALEKYYGEVDSDIIDFTVDTLCEIGGFPKGYSEVLELAENHVSAEEFKIYMNS